MDHQESENIMVIRLWMSYGENVSPGTLTRNKDRNKLSFYISVVYSCQKGYTEKLAGMEVILYMTVDNTFV